MSEQFALFVFHEHEAAGGADDLVLIGTMEECMARAESGKERTDMLVHIARLADLKIVRRMRREFVESYLTAVPHTWRWRWDEDDEQSKPD